MTNYAHTLFNETPQTEAIPNRSDQVRNNAGGFVFSLSDMDRVKRFLILGSEGGSFYVNERKLTIDNCNTLIRAIKEKGPEVVNIIAEISDKGLAAKNTPAIFALSLCISEKFADVATRQAAATVLPKVCRTGTHLFQFAESVKSARGWGRLLRNAFENWYVSKSVEQLSYLMTKYQSRITVEGKKETSWKHRDILLKSHTTPTSPEMDVLFGYIKTGELKEDANLPYIKAVIKAKTASKSEIINLIEEFNLPREVIPTKFLKDKDVLLTMLPKMPMTALIRNLGNLSVNGVLVEGAWNAIEIVTSKLENERIIRKSRIHPIQALSALMTYSQGHGFRGSNSWHPVGDIKQSLDKLFELSFQNVEPTGKRISIGLDVSGSMGFSSSIIPNLGITARDASAAMCMITRRKERKSNIVAFTHNLRELTIGQKDSIYQVVKSVSNLPFGGTDCSLPMLHALEQGKEYDAFIIYTDNETWAGRIHPFKALQRYREKSGIDAKLVVVGMTSTHFSIADPTDPGMLDIVGFDASAPSIISSFLKDEM